MSKQALFQGLVLDEMRRPLGAAIVGGEAQYTLDDEGFLRHIDAEQIDRAVIGMIREQIDANKDIVTESMMRMIGSDDLFTKAAIDVSIKNMDQVIERGIPDEARQWLGMMGFRVIVNVHGEVVGFDAPAMPIDEDE